jgi:ABC-type spermidine/putrescine transport system permease subunit I
MPVSARSYAAHGNDKRFFGKDRVEWVGRSLPCRGLILLHQNVPELSHQSHWPPLSRRSVRTSFCAAAQATPVAKLGLMLPRLAPNHARWVPVVALLAPAFAFLAAFTYLPVLRVLGESFLVGRFAGQHALGLDNYRRLFADPHFALAAWNNAAYAVGTIVPSLVLALLFALALRDTNRFTTVSRTFVVMPLMIPLVAAAALFSFILLPGEGLLDHYLAKLGVPAINWLGDTDLALGSVVAITVWKNTGYYMLFFLAGLTGVPQDLLDAATSTAPAPGAGFATSHCRCSVRPLPLSCRLRC